ncbi:MAG TPA: ABATE domain-containing protein [Rubrobacter sp.]|nr:ABATE domain-containing protein [Rubrobacter sp.]
MGSIRRERRFELKGGVVCLDFVNTVGWRLTERPSEYLRSYEDLLDWGRQAGLLAPQETEDLFRQATLDPEGAQEALSRALDLREEIHRVISRAIAGESQDESDLSALNRELSIALSHLRVMPADGAYGWGWDRSGGDGGARLDSPLWPVAQSAAELLTSPKLGRVKLCAGEGCGWVFLDESRNGSRRWCDSRDCGNRERVRRHLARKRASDS